MKALISEKSSNLINGLFFLFPLFSGVVESWHSTIFIVLTLWALFFCRETWSELEKAERLFLWAIVIYFALAALSLVNADDLYLGMKRLRKMSYLLGFVPLLLACRRLRLQPTLPFLYGMLSGSFICFAVAIYQTKYSQVVSRAHGITNPVIFGEICMLYALLSLLLLLLIYEPFRRCWFLVFVSFFAGSGASVLSQTRGAWIAFPVLFVFMVFFELRKLDCKRIIAGLLLFTLCGAGLTLLSGPGIKSRGTAAINHIQNAIDKDINPDTSIGKRFLMWGVAWEMFCDRPFIGSGLGDFPHDLKEAVREGKTALRTPSHPHAHSIYFEAFATTGIFGFVGMVLTIFVLPFYLFYVNWRRSISMQEQYAGAAGMVCVLAFAVFGLADAWLTHSVMVTCYVVCVLTFILGSSKGRRQWQHPG
jgi:O-antigen ligase